MHQRGDPEPGLALQTTLLRPQPRGALVRFDGAGAVHTGELADAVAGDVGERAAVLGGGHLALHRRDDAVLVEPVADELGGLLLEGHGLEQGGRPVSGLRLRQRRGDGREARLGPGGPRRVRRRHPFTAPVRPPTIRRWKTAKNTSAGIIDSEVNARTRAVSTEYCDENAWTPSGSV